jgi:hypothetical protein
MSEVEPYASPIPAYKLARLTKIEGSLRFAPLNSRPNGAGFYENPAKAVCEELVEHEVPHKTCTCGFYAVADRMELWRLGWHTLETATLQVLLYGRIVEHKHGYRAEHQEVQAVEVAGRCWWCGDAATVLAKRRRKQRYLASSCDRCAKLDVTTLERAGMDLGCEIGFATELEDKASTRTEKYAMAVQTLPALAIAGAASAIAMSTGVGEIAGIGGLTAGGWLIPGRMLAERILRQAGLGVQEVYRVVARTAGWALFSSIGGWGVAAIISIANTSI